MDRGNGQIGEIVQVECAETVDDDLDLDSLLAKYIKLYPQYEYELNNWASDQTVEF